MRELERELRALGGTLEFPPTPDLAPAVRARIAAPPTARVLPWRRALALSLVVLAAVAGAVLAVAPARTAVLEWLGLRGVGIERVPERSDAPQEGTLAVGEAVTLAEARRRAGFRVRVPALGPPDAVHLATEHVAGPAVSLVYADGDGVRLLLTQFRARIDEDFLQKLVAPGTTVERTRVGDAPAFWIEGEPHEIFYVDEEGVPLADTVRLAGNTLLWQRGAVTYRLEGAASEGDAVRIARSLR